MLKRVETLEDVGNVAAFAASDLARTMTATDINITCGRVADWVCQTIRVSDTHELAADRGRRRHLELLEDE